MGPKVLQKIYTVSLLCQADPDEVFPAQDSKALNQTRWARGLRERKWRGARKVVQQGRVGMLEASAMPCEARRINNLR